MHTAHKYVDLCKSPENKGRGYVCSYYEPFFSSFGGYTVRKELTSSRTKVFFISLLKHTVIRFVSTSAKFGPCAVVSTVNATLVEDKICTFKGECAQISDGTSAKTDNSTLVKVTNKREIFLLAYVCTPTCNI